MSTIDLSEIHSTIGAVSAPSLVGIGDNVLDCYLHENLAYPGGNALNVAAYSKLMFGGEAGFVGICGDDRFAEHLLTVLAEIGVDSSNTRRAHGPNGMAFVALDDEGDRRFVGSNRGGVQHELRLRITEQDHEYIAGFSGVHTSVFSSIDNELAAIAERGTRISYDYSDRPVRSHLAESAPHVEVGFFSGSDLTTVEQEDLAHAALDLGMKIAVITLGSRGALAFTRTSTTSVRARPVLAIDALGAGDAFITGFLAAQSAGQDLDGCMGVAAAAGALACTYRGAFGYPVGAGEDARAMLIRRHSAHGEAG